MNRVLASILLGSVAALPAVALADPPVEFYPTTVWNAPYVTLQDRDAQSVVYSQGTPTTGWTTVSLPFEVWFNGTRYTEMKFGAKGYVTFGAAPANSGSVVNFVNANANTDPKNMIAVWWGDNFCEPSRPLNQLRTSLGTTGDLRTFTVEWRCNKANTNGDPSGTTFSAKLVIFENKREDESVPPATNNVLRAIYGDVLIANLGDWTGGAAWGQRLFPAPAGEPLSYRMGPNANGGPAGCSPSGNPAPRCQGAHFPKNTVIQYGLFPEADLSARVKVQNVTLANDHIELDLENAFSNGGRTDARGVTYNVFLRSPTLGFDFQVGGHGTAFDVPSQTNGMIVVDSQLRSATVPTVGTYNVCLDIDPSRTIPEADRTNNKPCSTNLITIGPDVTGTIPQPFQLNVQAKQRVPVTVNFSNLGTQPASDFEFVITLLPVLGEGTGATIIDPMEYEIYRGTFAGTLDAGATNVPVTVQAELPPTMRNDKYVYKLYIDPNRLTPDADRVNNTYQTPTNPTTLKVTNQKPKLAITVTPAASAPKLTFPHGCYYGQPMVAEYQLCNDGTMDAWGFQTGVVVSDTNTRSAADPATVSAPQYCGNLDNPDSFNRRMCLPVEGIETQCEYGYCIVPCDPDDNPVCPTGTQCLRDYAWMTYLAGQGTPSAEPLFSCQVNIPRPSPRRCVGVRASGNIPRADKADQVPLVAGKKYFHIVDDLNLNLSATAQAVWTNPDPIDCYESLPDFTAAGLKVPDRVVAGEPVSVERTIRNLKFIEFRPGQLVADDYVSVKYGYYLAKERENVSERQIRAKVTSTDGYGVATVGSISSGLRTDDRKNEVIVIPPEIEPGLWYLGVVVDPENEVRELDERNNRMVYETPIVVSRPSLQIEGELPSTVVVGSSLAVQFVALGGTGACQWSASSLPPGLGLNPDGLLSGKIVDNGSYPFQIRATCGNLGAARSFILQAVPYSGSLEITTSSLPPARRSARYGGWYEGDTRHDGVPLAASGGKPPYTWAVVEGRLPSGLVLSKVGDLTVIAGATTANSETFKLQVSDTAGNAATKTLFIDIVGTENLAFDRTDWPNGATAVEYISTCVTVSGGTSTTNYVWAYEGVPPGLEAATTSNKLCLSGLPNKAGNYLVRVTAIDAKRQSRTVTLPLAITATNLPINDPGLGIVKRNDVVSAQLSVNARELPPEQVVFTLVSGSLPEGIVLTKDGKISGTVSASAASGTYNFQVRAEDDKGRIGHRALAFGIESIPLDPKVETKTEPKCSSVGTADLSLLGLALAGITALRRPARRRQGGAD